MAQLVDVVTIEDLSEHPAGRYHRTYSIEPIPAVPGGFSAGFGPGFAVYVPAYVVANMVQLPEGTRRLRLNVKTIALPGGAQPFPAPLLISITVPGIGAVLAPTTQDDTWDGLVISDFDGWTELQLRSTDRTLIFLPTVSSGQLVSMQIEGPAAFNDT